MTRAARGRVVLIGAVHEALPALDALLASAAVDVVSVVTSTRVGARGLSGAVNLARPAQAAGVPVIRADNANDPGVVTAIRSLAPDLLIVVGWNQLINSELLAVPRRGCVGFHASLLPRHRGHAPVNWAILRGETNTGNTMMLLDPGADTGDVVAQQRIRIGPNDTCASIYHQVGQVGATMLVTHLPALLAGTAERHPQRRADGDVLPRRTPDMGIIDWDQPARVVHDHVRALTLPYPGAFTMVRGRRVMVWATNLPGDREPRGPRGRVFALERPGIRVGVLGGSILVTRMSEAEANPEHARRWFRRARLSLGYEFDPVPASVSRWARGERLTSAVAG
ncbi:MAG: methionyl-tRNA formyltransferase [Actinomycetota bacterium]|nr:methionyl-tRNA formyltransferase [Actinomycetota bacterium]